jgi:hypothetical protein
MDSGGCTYNNLHSVSRDSLIESEPGGSRNNRPADMTHGRKSERSESVATCLAAMRKSALEGKLQEIQESIYRSRRTQPVGKGRTCPFRPMDHVFGKKLESMGSVRDLFRSRDGDDDRRSHQLYRKTHHSYYPGEQMDRNYVWPDAISSNFAFGLVEKKSDSITTSIKWNSS